MKKILVFILLALLLTGCARRETSTIQQAPIEYVTSVDTSTETEAQTTKSSSNSFTYSMIEDTDEECIIINNNIPFFTESELMTGWEDFIELNELDDLGRCESAMGSFSYLIGDDGSRDSLQSVTPAGWHNASYPGIIGKEGNDTVYNRSHLLMNRLSGLEAEPKVIFTGTHRLNQDLMLETELKVCNYISNHTEQQFLFRATPIYKNNELVPRGILLEGYAYVGKDKVIESSSELCFCVYYRNYQPGIEIDYMTGYTKIDAAYKGTLFTLDEVAPEDAVFVLNTSSKKIHTTKCESVSKMAEHNRAYVNMTLEELEEHEYTPCGSCHPK